jgi:hypothetical protein
MTDEYNILFIFCWALITSALREYSWMVSSSSNIRMSMIYSRISSAIFVFAAGSGWRDLLWMKNPPLTLVFAFISHEILILFICSWETNMNNMRNELEKKLEKSQYVVLDCIQKISNIRDENYCLLRNFARLYNLMYNNYNGPYDNYPKFNKKELHLLMDSLFEKKEQITNNEFIELSNKLQLYFNNIR